MKRAVAIKRAADWDRARAVDCVMLDAGDRNRRRIVLSCEGGTRILLDLPKPESNILFSEALRRDCYYSEFP